MRTLTRALLLVCITGAASPGTADEPAAAALDRSLSFIGDGEPGCAVAVVRRGRIVARAVRGLANLDTRTPISPSTVFYIASMSKQFTAMAVGLLVEDGKVGLDDDVRKWIPELPAYATPVRIRHLLHHTGGLRRIDDLLRLSGVSPYDLVSPETALEIIARQRRPNFAAGSEADYSNTGFVLLGLIVERASGQSLPQLARARIFAPLGMRDTQYVADHSIVIPRRADSYRRDADGWHRAANASRTIGDGGIFTTLDDLARWDANFYAPRVGARSAVALLTTPAALDDGRPLRIGSAQTGYGGGLFVGPRLGQPAQYHGGAWLEYRSDLTRFAERGLSFITLCNRRDRDAWSIVEPVAQQLLAVPSTPRPVAPPAPPGERDDARRLAGFYVDVDGAYWLRLAVAAGQLTWLPGVPLDRRSDGRFVARPEPAATFAFSTPRAGGLHVDWSFPGMPTHALDRVAPPARVALADYVGRYESADLGARTLVARGERLLARAHLEPWQALTAVGHDVFYDEDGAVLYTFRRDARGRVRGFALSTPGAKRLAYDRLPLD